MKHRLAALATALLLPVGTARAGAPSDFTGTTCGFLGAYDETLMMGNPALVVDEMFAVVAATDSDVPVRIVCELRVNQESLHREDSGTKSQVALVLYLSDMHETRDISSAYVDVCTTMWVGGATEYAGCEPIQQTRLVPTQACDVASAPPCENQEWHLLPRHVSG